MKDNKKTAAQNLEETLKQWVIEKYQPLINENERLEIKSKTYDMPLSKIIYVVYDRDQEGKIVSLGTIQECAEVLDRTPDYLRHCATPKAQKGNHKYKVVKLGKT
jgi:hypothetical protein